MHLMEVVSCRVFGSGSGAVSRSSTYRSMFSLVHAHHKCASAIHCSLFRWLHHLALSMLLNAMSSMQLRLLRLQTLELALEQHLLLVVVGHSH